MDKIEKQVGKTNTSNSKGIDRNVGKYNGSRTTSREPTKTYTTKRRMARHQPRGSKQNNEKSGGQYWS